MLIITEKWYFANQCTCSLKSKNSILHCNFECTEIKIRDIRCLYCEHYPFDESYKVHVHSYNSQTLSQKYNGIQV